MASDILSAFEIYKRINGAFQDYEKLPEIFTEDALVGNVACGHLQGLEAIKIFYHTTGEAGFEPEDYLWQMADGDLLTFGFRQFGGRKYHSPHFDGIGQLVFDESRGRFKYYYGVFDLGNALTVLGEHADRLQETGEKMQAAVAATKAYRAAHPDALGLLQSDSRYLMYRSA